MKPMILLIATVLFGGCSSETSVAPKFKEGEFVKSVLNNQVGQVTWAKCRSKSECYYHVRFVGSSMTTDTSLLGPDGHITTEPFSIVMYMKEYELKAN